MAERRILIWEVVNEEQGTSVANDFMVTFDVEESGETWQARRVTSGELIGHYATERGQSRRAERLRSL